MAKKILGAVGLLAAPFTGGASLALTGASLLKSGKKKAAAPAPEPAPTVMPTPDDEAIRMAKRRSLMRQMGRGGRTSTMLSGDSDTLGGG